MSVLEASSAFTPTIFMPRSRAACTASVISFMMIQALETGTVPLLIDSTVAFVVVGVTFFLFALAIPWANAKVIEITSKVLGLFTTAIAIEMLAKGAAGMVVAMHL